MIGSIDMLAIISSRPVTHIAAIGRLSGTSAQPPRDVLPLVLLGRGPSRIRKVVPRKVTKMTPPIRGPTRLPAMMPADSTPIAQPDRAFGVCEATSTVEPEA